MTTIAAVITTLDNRPVLERQLQVLQTDPWVSKVIVVNNGSQDGTAEYLDKQTGITVVHKENRGAGPGRNRGIDAAGEADYYQMIDGGIVPLEGGTFRMLEYLTRTPEADVIGVEIPDFETDPRKAWRRWPDPIPRAYRNFRLSHTAYCLCRARAWEGLRFSEEGPYGWPGWGVDDDEMMCRWNEHDIQVHVVTCACKLGKECSGVHPYRHASGSWARIVRESGVGPKAYGSTYEARLVKAGQDWPQWQQNTQWGEPWLTLVVEATDQENTAKTIKLGHDLLRRRRFGEGHPDKWNPYSIVLWALDADDDFRHWAEVHRWRQHQGTTVRPSATWNGQIINRGPGNEATWTGDFRIWEGAEWQEAVRPNAFYYSLVRDEQEVGAAVGRFNALHPAKASRLMVPDGRGEI